MQRSHCRMPDMASPICLMAYLNSQRKENLLIPRPVNEVYTYTIECPENNGTAHPGNRQDDPQCRR